MVAVVLPVVLLAGCVSDGPSESSAEEAEPVTEVSVTVPPVRLTPFCQAMIDLSDRLRTGEDEVSDTVIIETYRSISDVVPPEISSDFAAVLEALETGAPPPTDPPPETFATVPPGEEPTPATTAGTETDPESTTISTAEVLVDEGFAPGTSPSERINNYVTLACRGTQNNPGPPPTEPLEERSDDE